MSAAFRNMTNGGVDQFACGRGGHVQLGEEARTALVLRGCFRDLLTIARKPAPVHKFMQAGQAATPVT